MIKIYFDCQSTWNRVWFVGLDKIKLKRAGKAYARYTKEREDSSYMQLYITAVLLDGRNCIG